MEQTAQPSLRVARMLASSLVGGVALLWIVVWVITGGGRTGTSSVALAPAKALWICAVVTLAGFVGALVFRNRAVQVVQDWGASGATPPMEKVGEVQINLLISWALLEGPALLSAAVLLLFGVEQVLWVTVPVYLLGVVMTFPQAEWFGENGSQTGGSGKRN